jgi:hypothetical protein
VIAHIILFEPRSNLTEREQKDLLDSFTAAAAVPGVRNIRIGRRILHGLPGYEQLMTHNFEYAAILEFDDVAALREYLKHPAHAAAGRHFTASAASALAYDYAFASADELVTLVSKKA